MKLSINKKIFFGFIINIFVIAAFGWISYKRIQNLKETSKLGDLEGHQQQVIIVTEKILSFVNNINNASKGYVITGNQKYIEKFDELTYSIQVDLDNLRHLYDKNKQAQQKIDVLKDLIEKKIENDNDLIDLKKYGHLEEKDGKITIAQDLETTDKILRSALEVQTQETGTFNILKAKSDSLEKPLSIIFITLLACSILLLVVVYFIIRYFLNKKELAEIMEGEEKNLLKSIINNTSDTVYIRNFKGEYLLINKQYERLIHKLNDEVKGKTPEEIFSKEIADELRESDINVIKSGKEVKSETTYDTENGPHTYGMVRFPLYDPKGKIYAVGGVGKDITESRKLNDFLKESEQRYRLLVDTIKDYSIVLIDTEGYVKSWSKGGEQITGYKADEIIGKHISLFYTPEEIKNGEPENLLKKAAELGNFEFNGTKIKKDGTEFMVNTVITALFNENKELKGFATISRDISEQKKIEEQLKNSEEKYRKIVEVVGDVIYTSDEHGYFTYINPACEKLIGYKQNEMLGKHFSEIVADGWKERVTEFYLNQFKNGIDETLFSFPIITKSGTEKWIEQTVIQLRDGNHITGHRSIVRDITARKLTEEKSKENEQHLNLLLNSIPEALIVINDEGNVVKWNPQAEKMFGWTLAEVTGKPIEKLILPEQYKEKYVGGLRNFLKTGKWPLNNKTIELSVINRKKEEFDVKITIEPALINDKYIFIAFIENISERKIMEREIIESEQFLDSIIENIPDILFVKEIKRLSYIRINKAAEQLLGLELKAVIGKTDADLFSKQQAEAFVNNDMEVIKSGLLKDIPEEIIDTKNGKRWLHTRIVPLNDDKGKPSFILGISEDITDKKYLEAEKNKAENLLHENEKRLRLILENIGEGVIVANNKEEIILSNHMAEEIIGIKQDTSTSSALDWSVKYDLYYPDEKTIFPAQNLPLEKALKGEVTDDVEIIIEDPASKTKKRVVISGRPIKDENNNIIAAVSTIKDITQYKKLEDALEESELKFRKLIGFGRNNIKQL